MQFKIKTIMVMLGALALTGCSLMSESLEECPQGISIQFVYDYNVERADMFPDHVGSVTLYVYDLDGNLVRVQTEDNTDASQPLRDPNYRMNIDGLQPGVYRLLALGNQRPYADLRQLSGIRYLRDGEDSEMKKLNVTLTDRSTGRAATAISQSLDTLWHGTVRSTSSTRAGEVEDFGGMQTVTVYDQEYTSCVISMVRDTKRLHLSIRQSDDPAHCDIADFEIKITDRNGHLLWDNSVDTDGTPDIVYRPFAEWNTYYDGNTGEGLDERPAGSDENIEESAHADIDFNRLMMRSGNAELSPAMLSIVRRSNGQQVALINLPEILSQGRGAFERYHYSQQEFLDRAYDYRLDFILVGGQWRFMTLGIHTLPWTLRFQHEILD